MEVTLETINKKMDHLLDNLAIVTAKGFNEVNLRLDAMENRLCSVENRLDTFETRLDSVDANIKSTRRDLLAQGDRFITRNEFDNHLMRFHK
jgi:tetrahydromethanopterin S-methyltransferase subunit G